MRVSDEQATAMSVCRDNDSRCSELCPYCHEICPWIDDTEINKREGMLASDILEARKIIRDIISISGKIADFCNNQYIDQNESIREIKYLADSVSEKYEEYAE